MPYRATPQQPERPVPSSTTGIVTSEGWSGSASLRWFELSGDIDSSPVRATWRDGRLCADAVLMDAARTLVGVGEVFAYPEESVTFSATLDGPVRDVLMTLLRACWRVRSLSVGV